MLNLQMDSQAVIRHQYTIQTAQVTQAHITRFSWNSLQTKAALWLHLK